MLIDHPLADVAQLLCPTKAYLRVSLLHSMLLEPGGEPFPIYGLLPRVSGPAALHRQ